MLKKIFNNLKENWITYGFETLVVIIGILVAFGLNNWNEGQKEKKLETQYLVRLVSDLGVDTSYYQNRINSEKMWLSGNTEFLKSIYKSQDSITDVRELLALLEPGTNPLTTHNPSYLELSRSGNLSIFRNQDLKASLSDYYRKNEDLSKQVDEFNQTSGQMLTDVMLVVGIIPRFSNSINYLPDDEEWQFLNDPASLKFQALETLGTVLTIRNREFTEHYKILKTEAQKLIVQIENEIQDRN